MNAKELVIELEETLFQLKQYRLLTNKLIQQHITQQDIDEFVDEEYIKSTDNHYYDYEFDLFNWLDTGVLEETIKFLKEV